MSPPTPVGPMDPCANRSAAAPATALARREFLAGVALLAAVDPARALAAPASRGKLRKTDASLALSPQHLLLRDVAQLVIPRGRTAGAGELGVGAFVLLGLAHGLAGSHEPVAANAPEDVAPHVGADHRFDYVGWLKAALDKAAGAPFLAQPPARRQALLAALDAQAFDPKAGWHPWKVIKKLILIGYYTSEVGGSKELNYVHVPGRFAPDLPLKPSDRAYSSDWTAVDFG